MKFWIDVTNTCKTPLNTGVPRTVRGVYSLLKTQGEVIPLRWDNLRKRYCRLTSTELKALEGDLEARPLKWWKGISRFWTALELEKIISSEDWFIQIEIFQDHRIEWIERYASRFQSLAIFHDAIALTHSSITAMERQPRFGDYMKSLHSFTQVVSISDYSVNALQSFWTQQCHLSPKFIHKLLWPVDFPEKMRSKSSQKESREIISISTLEQRKNHLTLIAACEILWNQGLVFSLKIIGKKCPAWGDQVIGKIEHLQKKGFSLSWVNQVTEEELHQFYQSSRFSVYPSLVEGFGLPILESLWHHRPCICSSEGAMAEVAKNGGCLTTDVTSAEKLAEALKLLLTDDALYHTLVEQTNSIVIKTWKDYGKELFPLFQSKGESSS